MSWEQDLEDFDQGAGKFWYASKVERKGFALERPRKPI